jgi:hypothetical protein
MATPTRHGQQVPRYHSVPEYVTTAGDDAIELARLSGLKPFPWQELVIRESMGEQPNGLWAAMEVGLIVGRQNGKGDVLMIRELAGLYLLDEKLIIHSAHEAKTAFEAFRRILSVIESVPDLERQVVRVSRSHGEEGIELRNGCRLRFLARTGGSGRGFSAPCVILDEAYALTTEQKAAIMPTLSAQRNPQIWYTSSAGLPQSVELGRVHKRGVAGDPGLAYFGWSVDPNNYDPASLEHAAEANPSYGYLIRPDVVAMEQRSMDPETYARERLGLGQYPSEDGGWEYIPRDTWNACQDEGSEIDGPLALAVDVTPDRTRATISAAGRRKDGRFHVEVIDSRPGTEWIDRRVDELRERWKPISTSADGRSPAASLELRLSNLTLLSSADVAQAAASMYDEAVNDNLRHRGDPRLTEGMSQVKRQEYGDGSFYLRRKGNQADISAVTSCSQALFAIQAHKPARIPQIFI